MARSTAPQFVTVANAPQPDHTPADQAPPVEPVIVPDPAKAPDLALTTLAGIVGLIERIASSVPTLHGIDAPLAALRANFEALVFHSTPPAQPPK